MAFRAPELSRRNSLPEQCQVLLSANLKDRFFLRTWIGLLVVEMQGALAFKHPPLDKHSG